MQGTTMVSLIHVQIILSNRMEFFPTIEKAECLSSPQVFQREKLNGNYGVAAFAIGNTLSTIPYLILITFLSGTMCYYMVRLHPGFSYYLFFVLCLYSIVIVVESLMMDIASVVPNFLMWIIIGVEIQVELARGRRWFSSLGGRSSRCGKGANKHGVSHHFEYRVWRQQSIKGSATGYYRQEHDRSNSSGSIGNVYIAESQAEGHGISGPVRVHVRGPIDGLAGIGRGATYSPVGAWPPTRNIFSRVPFGLGNRNCQQSLANDDSEARVDLSGDLSGDGLTALVSHSQVSNSINVHTEQTERVYEVNLQGRYAGTASHPSSNGLPVQMLGSE